LECDVLTFSSGVIPEDDWVKALFFAWSFIEGQIHGSISSALQTACNNSKAMATKRLRRVVDFAQSILTI
jgi:hypothetical protein